MKALIVLGGDAPGVRLLKVCAAEADFSIAADRGLEAFDAAGIEPDMLIGCPPCMAISKVLLKL